MNVDNLYESSKRSSIKIDQCRWSCDPRLLNSNMPHSNVELSSDIYLGRSRIGLEISNPRRPLS